jgi:hypothetical protein
VFWSDDQEVNFVTAEVSPRNVKNVVKYGLNSLTAGTVIQFGMEQFSYLPLYSLYFLLAVILSIQVLTVVLIWIFSVSGEISPEIWSNWI